MRQKPCLKQFIHSFIHSLSDTHTHKSISKRFPTERYKEGREERSSDYVVSVKALGGNCSGTRGDTETANPGPDRDITKGAQRDKGGTRKGHH